MTTEELRQKKCTACEGTESPLEENEIDTLRGMISPGWSVKEGHHLEREFRFDDFRQALGFVNKEGQLAEQENHHPDIYLAWGRVKITLWSHKIDGLHKNDFILAAKIDEIN